MTSRVIPVSPFTLVVFGATGDLAQRKLLPALFHRDLAGQIPDAARIVGVSRRPLSDEDFRKLAHGTLLRYAAGDATKSAAVSKFLNRLHYISADAGDDRGWPALAKLVQQKSDHIQIFYLAVAPDLFGALCKQIAKHHLAGPKARVVVEKPIGHDLASARAVNEVVGGVFTEDNIYRIDHYLGKETVQNLMALRFANALFEPVWNSTHIDHVQITVAESLGLEGRGAYYDKAGAMRDMVQNHMLQLLCLAAMEPPTSLTADAVRDEKLKILKSLKPIDERNAASVTVRGQYRAGATNGNAVNGYADECGGAASDTESFVALKVEIQNWRWAQVPFYLRTGKRLSARASEIVVAFRQIPHSIFDGSAGPIRPNRLVIRLQPDEGVKLWLMIKDPGPGGMRLSHVPLDMSFAEAFSARNPDAYERLLLDVVRGNQTLFMRRDEVEAAWAWIDPILTTWQQSKEPPKPYTAGTWGPSAAIALIERDGRTWHEEEADYSPASSPANQA